MSTCFALIVLDFDFGKFVRRVLCHRVWLWKFIINWLLYFSGDSCKENYDFTGERWVRETPRICSKKETVFECDATTFLSWQGKGYLGYCTAVEDPSCFQTFECVPINSPFPKTLDTQAVLKDHVWRRPTSHTHEFAFERHLHRKFLVNIMWESQRKL